MYWLLWIGGGMVVVVDWVCNGCRGLGWYGGCSGLGMDGGGSELGVVWWS